MYTTPTKALKGTKKVYKQICLSSFVSKRPVHFDVSGSGKFSAI